MIVQLRWMWHGAGRGCKGAVSMCIDDEAGEREIG